MSRQLVRMVGMFLVGCLLMPVLVDARDYDPKTGRFLQRDPETPGQVRVKKNKVEVAKPTPPATNPQELHPYLYVGNNPINRLDPTGETSIPGCPTCVPAGGIGVGLPPGVNLPLPLTTLSKKDCLLEEAEDPDLEECYENCYALFQAALAACQAEPPGVRELCEQHAREDFVQCRENCR